MATMYGPAFDESGQLVQREVPDVDVQAYEKAGYKMGALPDNLKPSKADRDKAAADAQKKADVDAKAAETAEAEAKKEVKPAEQPKAK
jgi:hypothetical protein